MLHFFLRRVYVGGTWDRFYLAKGLPNDVQKTPYKNIKWFGKGGQISITMSL